MKTGPAFVLVWLLSFYIVIGVVETLVTIPARRRAARDAERREARQTPPAP